MTLTDILTALQQTPFATAIVEGSYLFPVIESIHVAAVVTVVGTISIVDLRLIGLAAHTRSIRQLMRQVLPLTWGAFAIALASGFLLFASKAVDYAANTPFRFKMALLLLAGVNMAVFHMTTYRSADGWDELTRTPGAAKAAGLSSLAIWVGVICFGRWIGFTLM